MSNQIFNELVSQLSKLSSSPKTQDLLQIVHKLNELKFSNVSIPELLETICLNINSVAIPNEKLGLIISINNQIKPLRFTNQDEHYISSIINTYFRLITSSESNHNNITNNLLAGFKLLLLKFPENRINDLIAVFCSHIEKMGNDALVVKIIQTIFYLNIKWISTSNVERLISIVDVRLHSLITISKENLNYDSLVLTPILKIISLYRHLLQRQAYQCSWKIEKYFYDICTWLSDILSTTISPLPDNGIECKLKTVIVRYLILRFKTPSFEYTNIHIMILRKVIVILDNDKLNRNNKTKLISALLFFISESLVNQRIQNEVDSAVVERWYYEIWIPILESALDNHSNNTKEMNYIDLVLSGLEVNPSNIDIINNVCRLIKNIPKYYPSLLGTLLRNDIALIENNHWIGLYLVTIHDNVIIGNPVIDPNELCKIIKIIWNSTLAKMQFFGIIFIEKYCVYLNDTMPSQVNTLMCYIYNQITNSNPLVAEIAVESFNSLMKQEGIRDMISHFIEGITQDIIHILHKNYHKLPIVWYDSWISIAKILEKKQENIVLIYNEVVNIWNNEGNVQIEKSTKSGASPAQSVWVIKWLNVIDEWLNYDILKIDEIHLLFYSKVFSWLKKNNKYIAFDEDIIRWTWKVVETTKKLPKKLTDHLDYLGYYIKKNKEITCDIARWGLYLIQFKTSDNQSNVNNFIWTLFDKYINLRLSNKQNRLISTVLFIVNSNSHDINEIKIGQGIYKAIKAILNGEPNWDLPKTWTIHSYCALCALVLSAFLNYPDIVFEKIIWNNSLMSIIGILEGIGRWDNCLFKYNFILRTIIVALCHIINKEYFDERVTLNLVKICVVFLHKQAMIEQSQLKEINGTENKINKLLVKDYEENSSDDECNEEMEQEAEEKDKEKWSRFDSILAEIDSWITIDEYKLFNDIFSSLQSNKPVVINTLYESLNSKDNTIVKNILSTRRVWVALPNKSEIKVPRRIVGFKGNNNNISNNIKETDDDINIELDQ